MSEPATLTRPRRTPAKPKRRPSASPDLGITCSIVLPTSIWDLVDAEAAKENRNRSQWFQVELRKRFGLPMQQQYRNRTKSRKGT